MPSMKNQIAEELRAYAKSPRDWPKWPRLPLKRPRTGSWPEFGFLFEIGIQDKPDIRFLAKSAYDKMTIEEVKSAPKADIEKLVQEGWEVD